MFKHFEELWEQCEQLHQDIHKDEQVSLILDELMMKINLYKAIDQKTDISPEEHQKIKSRTLGEILLTLTSLSLKDNINVFASLNDAFKYRSIGYYANKNK